MLRTTSLLLRLRLCTLRCVVRYVWCVCDFESRDVLPRCYACLRLHNDIRTSFVCPSFAFGYAFVCLVFVVNSLRYICSLRLRVVPRLRVVAFAFALRFTIFAALFARLLRAFDRSLIVLRDQFARRLPLHTLRLRLPLYTLLRRCCLHLLRYVCRRHIHIRCLHLWAIGYIARSSFVYVYATLRCTRVCVACFACVAFSFAHFLRRVDVCCLRLPDLRDRYVTRSVW